MRDFLDTRTNRMIKVTGVVGNMIVYEYFDTPNIVEMLDSKFFSNIFKNVQDMGLPQTEMAH